jgi:hypothetical protein
MSNAKERKEKQQFNNKNMVVKRIMFHIDNMHRYGYDINLFFIVLFGEIYQEIMQGIVTNILPHLYKYITSIYMRW